MRKYTEHIRAYGFEIYTKDPITGTSGWDIEHLDIYAKTKQDAESWLLNFPNFDCIIMFLCGTRLTDPQITHYEKGYDYNFINSVSNVEFYPNYQPKP